MIYWNSPHWYTLSGTQVADYSALAPINSVAPTISGTAQVGQTLTGTNGTWSNNPTSYTYQWMRAGAAISGATNLTYVPVTADIGNALMLVVTAINASGSVSAASSATASVIAVGAAPVNSAPPVITGTPATGQTLTGTYGTWSGSPTGYTYQWNRNSVAISGATAITYVVVTADVGNALTLTVTATNANGSATATSAATSNVVVSAPSNSSVPTVSGTAQVGQTLTGTNGAWTNTPTGYTYQWSRGATAISGATAITYVPVTADVGNTLTLTVTATNGTGSASASSAATASVIAAQADTADSTTTTYDSTSYTFDRAA